MLETNTILKLKNVIPDSVLEQIPDTAAKFNINSPLRLAHFLAQCAHESGSFKRVRENLNYSETRMLEIFKSDFDVNHDRILSTKEKEKAKSLVGHPDKIANFVYANQNGNGSEASGDGYKYAGKGFIMLTGRKNYAEFDKLVEDNIIANPDLVATKYPLMSAAYFFQKNSLWSICDKGATDVVVTSLTKRVNGGTYGLAERIKYFNKFYKILVG